MNIALLAGIANAFATLASNPAFGKDAAKVAPIASLVGLAFQATAMADADRAVLLVQIQNANVAGRGLTDEEVERWEARHETAKAAIQGWLPSYKSP